MTNPGKDSGFAALTILGSSSGVPAAERSCSGYLIESGGRLTLIDCGSGVTSAFLRFGFDPLKVDRIVISHTHADHVSDLPLFIQMIHLTRRENRLDVYLPEEYVVPFQIGMRAMYLFPERFSFDFQIHGYREGPVPAGDVGITAVRNSHLVKLEEFIAEHTLPNKMQSFSFIITHGGKRLFYSGDVGGVDDIRDYVTDCDYIVTELTHVDHDAFFPLASQLPSKRIIVTHVDDNKTTNELLARARDAGVTNLVIAQDGMKIEL